MDQLKVFISYRRADTSHVAGRLGDRVGARFSVFMDIDDIPPGTDFTAVVRQAIGESDVLLVLIGPHYLDADAHGVRRLDKSGDWVAEEVAVGLARDITVVPVLVDGTPMPSAADLPTQLQALSRRQASSLTHASFNADAERLMGVLDAIEQTRSAEQADDGAGRSPAEPTGGAARADLFSDPDYARAIAAAFHSRWSEAIRLFEGLDHRFSADDRIRGPLGEARESLRLERLEAQATAAEAEQDWRVAATSLGDLMAARPDDRDLAERLAAARREVTVDDLSHQLRALFTAREWAGVGVLSQRIAAIDATRSDPNGLATRAAENLDEQRVVGTYTRSLSAYAEGRPAEALSGFLAVQAERPGFREVDDLVAMLRAKGAVAADRGAGPTSARVESPAAGQPPAAAAGPASSAPTRALHRGIWWVAAVAVLLLVGLQVPLHPYAEQDLETVVGLLVGSLVCLLVVVVLFVGDARELAADRVRTLRRCAVGAVVAGVVVRSVVWSFNQAMIDGGMEQDGWWGVFGVVVPVLAAGAGYAVVQRKVGRWAVWPVLVGLFVFLAFGLIRLVPLYAS